MRIIFAGTPDFARVALERLQSSGHTICLAMSQPDRPGGRGMKLQASAVKQFALDHGIALAQPRSLKLDGKYPQDAAVARQAIADARADVMVVAAYGLILPQWVLDDMAAVTAWRNKPLGCLNIHASLLPRWRGAAPIHRAIEAGDAQTGVTIMQMDAGLDTGNLLLEHRVPIPDGASTATLHDELAQLGATLIVEALDRASAGCLPPRAQPAQGVTYAHKIEKHEAAIDWREPADVIVRRVRAFDPFPGATGVLQGELLKIWVAESGHAAAKTDVADVAVALPAAAPEGVILAVARTGIAIAAMNSIVLVTQLQRAGGKRLAVAEFLRGFDVQVGMRFDVSAAPTAMTLPSAAQAAL